LLPKSPRLRRILLAYTVNELGTWLGYVALALAVYDHTRSAIATAGLFVARGFLPALLAPVLVARTERSERRGGLTWLYVIEAALTVGLAALLWRFWLPGVLVLVALDGAVAVAATALVRAAAARVAIEDAPQAVGPDAQQTRGPDAPRALAPHAADMAQRQANAALNFSFMIVLAIGPAIGAALVRGAGGPAALLVDAASFAVCAALLVGVHSHVQEGAEESVRNRLAAALRHIWEVPQLRVLLITEAVAIVFFASVEPVEVIYANATLGAGALGYGLLLGIWGAGAALGAVVFAKATHRPLGPMLVGGTLLVGLAYLGFAAAPTLAIACIAAAVGGFGNGVQWPSLVSAVQQLTPDGLQGRIMSAVGSMGALCPAIGFAMGGALVAVGSPRIAMAVAGIVAALTTGAFLRLPLHGLQSTGDAETTLGPEPSLVTSAR
jgi:Transmembrane secretion effector